MAASAASARAPATCAAPGFSCSTLDVPLDRTGSVPGVVRLQLTVERTRQRPRGTVLLLAGGPGQSALALAAPTARLLRAALHGYRLVTFDQRGTGLSGALDCPELQASETSIFGAPDPRAVQACGARLGRRRGLYSTTATVADIEAVRRALRVGRLAVLGVSYGSYVAERYARAHPDRVERLALDSVVPQEAPAALLGSTFNRLPAVLALLCGHRACASFTRDPVADVAKLVSRLRRGPVRGRVGAGGGGRPLITLREPQDLLDLLVSASAEPDLLAHVPGAASSARRGDYLPLLRLAALSVPGRPAPTGIFSAGLNAATLCSDVFTPWGGPASDPSRRDAAVESAVGTLSDRSLFPFDRGTVARSPLLATCLPWPATEVPPPPPPGVLARVPTLLLSGQLDLLTPASDAGREAGRAPGATLVSVPGAGHSVLASGTRCALVAVARLFAGRAVGAPCARQRSLLAAPPDPRSLATLVLPAALHGEAGRVLGATLATVEDAQWLTGLAGSPRVIYGGLRGGALSASARRGRRRLALRRDTYVPGVAVSGTISVGRGGAWLGGGLVVGGRHGGRIRVSFDGAVSGTLAGQRVHLRLRSS